MHVYCEVIGLLSDCEATVRIVYIVTFVQATAAK